MTKLNLSEPELSGMSKIMVSVKQRICLGFLFLAFLFIRFYRWLVKIGWRRMLLYACTSVFLIIGVVEGWAWYRFTTTPLIQPGSTTIIVKPNSTLRQLAISLQQRGLITHPRFFILFAHQRGQSNRLRVGEYAVEEHMTPKDLLNNIVAGKVVMRKLTFVEGATMRQIRELLLKNDSLQHIAVNMTDQEIMAALGRPGELPEGRFFPDTYIYTWGNKDIIILQQAYQRMTDLLNQEWLQRAPNLPYKTLDEALIVASLVESEAVLPVERSVIAGVILRRLQQNMNLQIDPTVIYGIGKPFGSVITLEDLHNDNLYNTYMHKGLPPTPINMPSAASIYAALHPAEGDALYYVAQGNGGHRFSATYPEHLQAVKQYREYKKSEADKQQWFGLGLFIIRSTSFY
jgi:UPF0755 protein